MAINVQYGPIGTALGLAQQAGAGRRNARVATQDLQFLQMMQQAQAEADRNYANQIQMALQAQQANANNSLRAEAVAADRDRQAQELEFRKQQANLAQQNVQADNTRQNAALQFRADQAGQEAATLQSQQAKQAGYLQSLPDGPVKQQALDYFAATGKLPETVIPQNPRVAGSNLPADYRMLDAQYRRTENQLRSAQTVLKALSSGGDPLKESRTMPGAIKGQEAQFVQAQARVQEIQKELESLGSILEQQSVPQANINAIIQAQQQPAPAASQGTPTINSAQEYAALPSGTVYINGRTGQSARKP